MSNKILWGIAITALILSLINTGFLIRTYQHMFHIVQMVEQVTDLDEKKDSVIEAATSLADTVTDIFGKEEE
jgi:hypothetical protein